MTVEPTAIRETAGIVNNLIESSTGLIKELIRAGMSSPILGFAATMIITDILERKAKILSADTALFIKIMAGATMGVDITTELIGAIGQAAAQIENGINPTHIFNVAGNSSSPDLAKPSAQVLNIFDVKSSADADRIVSSLVANLQKKPGA